jgi:hypothetical protein
MLTNGHAMTQKYSLKTQQNSKFIELRSLTFTRIPSTHDKRDLVEIRRVNQKRNRRHEGSNIHLCIHARCNLAVKIGV